MTRPVIRFLGGVGTVTGSKFLLDTGRSRVLLDCGLFQGHKELRLRNRAPLPVEPHRIDAVVVTHAHLDHLGYLPALVRAGFAGPVHVTRGTAAIGAIVLADAARLQEEDASYANRVGSSRHHPAGPLFDERDAAVAVDRFAAHDLDTSVPVTDDVSVTFRHAGHILGAASIVVRVAGMAPLVVSGDLGRGNHPLLSPPDPLGDVEGLETVLVESTYGGRVHPPEDPVTALAAIVTETAARGGTVVIPSFAVDRTEVLLMHLRDLVRNRMVPDLPVFVDSPMALDGLRVYRQAIAERWPGIRPEIEVSGDPFDTGRLNECRTVGESKGINAVRYPSVIIAGSGMAAGGRILHHLTARLPDPRTTVVLPGHQVAGTRGRQLIEGAHEIKIFGEYVDVRAQIVHLPGFTVHAGQDELVGWVSSAPETLRTCFVVHGEPDESDALAGAIRSDSIRSGRRVRAIVARDDEIVVAVHSR